MSCVVYAKSVSFMHEAFYCFSHCDINKALRIISQEDEKMVQVQHISFKDWNPIGKRINKATAVRNKKFC